MLRLSESILGDDKVPVTFLDYSPQRPLQIRTGTVDIVLMQPGAASELGGKPYSLIFRETARVLKRDGKFLLFNSASESLPGTAENFFEIEEESEGAEGVSYYLLKRKAKKKKRVQDEARKPRRKVLGFTLDELEDALDD